LEPERVTEKLRQHTFWFDRDGAVTHAISGIDIALWDILGKTAKQPVGRLLGGRYRTRVRAYASVLMDDTPKTAERLSLLREQGYTAIKMGWGPFGRKSDSVDEQIVCAARKAVGDDCLLMVDAGGSDTFWSNGYKWALRTAHMLADFCVYWFEEPLDPDDRRGYVLLRQNAPVQIAGGEVMSRRQSFTDWIQAGAFDIVQPDVTKVGGLSQSRRIAWTARDNGIKMIPHGWNTAVGLAADLHLASALPDTDLVEYIVGSPYVDELPLKKWSLDEDGMLPVPEIPGLGIELDYDVVKKYTGVQLL
jgi:L-alanine-DL-glutamate epimerase-like enolase superfamily enzyme